MHGLINKAIQSFIRDTYGEEVWEAVRLSADLPFPEFEAMLIYEDALTDRVIDAAATRLGKTRATVLEDLGTYLVTHPNLEPLRRLFRFGGFTFVEFLHSLDDLRDRVRLALPDLEIPRLRLTVEAEGAYRVDIRDGPEGFGHVLEGIIRGMADDYGALALLEHECAEDGAEWIRVHVVDTSHSEGRAFSLAKAG